MPLRAVIFDFDGVLVDSEKYWKIEEESFFHEILRGWDGMPHSEIVGLSVEGSYRFFQRTYGLTLPLQEFIDQYGIIADRVYAECAPLPDAEALLQNLSQAGLAMAIASSARRKRIEKTLAKFNLGHYFPILVSAEDLPENAGKPDPTIYRVAAQLLGIAPEECVAIEDAENGVRSAKAAGMKCIALRNGENDTQNLSEADREISTLKEIDEHLIAQL